MVLVTRNRRGAAPEFKLKAGTRAAAAAAAGYAGARPVTTWTRRHGDLMARRSPPADSESFQVPSQVKSESESYRDGASVTSHGDSMMMTHDANVTASLAQPECHVRPRVASLSAPGFGRRVPVSHWPRRRCNRHGRRVRPAGGRLVTAGVTVTGWMDKPD